MGGFILYVNDCPQATLTPGELLRFVRDGSVDMPDIDEEDLEDRSKGDVLSKGIAILQLLWFVLQLAARYVQDLPMTLLEIDTLAVAALTCIAYGWWWKKPKDVGRPSPVHWKDIAPSPSRFVYGYVVVFLAKSVLICLHFSEVDARYVAAHSFSYLYYLFHPCMSIMSAEPVISPGAAHSRRVPTIGGYVETHDDIIIHIGCFSGMVFGAIHCLGWHFLFQRQTDQILWDAASLAILCVLVFIFLLS
jgi:hypothetical protein